MSLRSVFDGARTTAATVVLASSMMTAQAGMAGQSPVIIELPELSGGKTQTPHGPERVDRLVVVAIDVSKSVENDEYRPMMKGFYQALLSDEVGQSLKAGMKYGIATFFFCGESELGEVAILRTLEDAQAFAEKAFWNAQTGNPYDKIPCNNTKINVGLLAARSFILEEEKYGIASTERSVVVIGDGMNSPRPMNPEALRNITIDMARQQKTVVYGIPVTIHADSGADLVDYYARFVTPPGLTYDTGEGYDYPLKEGRVTPASGFEDVARAARETFMLSMY